MDLFYTRKGYATQYPNKYYYHDNYIMIRLYSQSKGEKFVMIDKEDFDKVNICNWKLRTDSMTFYALNSNNGFMHRLIMSCPKDKQVDHINGNGLDNRKTNLRIVTGRENSRSKHNSTSKTGLMRISYTCKENRYRVHYKDFNGKQCSKSFSVSKYGELALDKAKEFELEIREKYYNYKSEEINNVNN